MVRAEAGICPVEEVPMPADFPTQPINIFIPRSSASGALELSERIATSIGNLEHADGRKLGVKVNLLFKFGGDMGVALEYFSSLPPNGYNVLQLTDTYASRIAEMGEPDVRLTPLNIAQITFSQIYIRTYDTRFSDLDSFLAYASDSANPSLRIAKFGSDESGLGLEDFLLTEFREAYPVDVADRVERITLDTDPAADATTPDDAAPLRLEPAGYESGSERYFSLFDKANSEQQTDALIEQPGDVARLIDGGLIKPIFTLLPEGRVADWQRLGATPTFAAEDNSDSCNMHYRFRGFFVPEGLPADRRAFLEWLFLAAFNSESFGAFNHAQYMDLLYRDAEILDTYCSASYAEAFFRDSIEDYRDCFAAVDAGGVD